MLLDTLYRCIRPLLFLLDAERSHSVALRSLRVLAPLIGNHLHVEQVQLLGLHFKNRVGLAAGFDKDGDTLVGVSKLGFGFVEIGSVTRRPQTGNPTPRLFRVKEQQAIINRLGFNSKGVEHVCKVLEAQKNKIFIPIGINVGRNADTPNSSALLDIEYCLAKLKDIADFITINISSPNTTNLRDLGRLDQVDEFLAGIVGIRNEISMDFRAIPLLVKISPDDSDSHIAELSRRIQGSGCDGIIATNTTVDRSEVSDVYAEEIGGLSGKPLLDRSLEVVKIIREAVGPVFPVIGVGGISSKEDAQKMLTAGADLVQLYTALVYQGPGLVTKIAKGLATGN